MTRKRMANWTRRQFLEGVGLAGGAAALHETMTAMGLMGKTSNFTQVQVPKLNEGKSVVILGGGVGGLTAAYELQKANYQVTILEAQKHLGGRSLTVRRGDTFSEVDRDGNLVTQECKFDEVSGQPLYLNAGPGRIPYHHRRLIHYCKQLNVDLEVYVMNTMANLFQTDKAFGGEAQIYRRVANDTRGYIAEMLSKAVNSGLFDMELNEGDRDNLLSLLGQFGALKNGVYRGSDRSGCLFPESVYDGCVPETPLPFKTLLNSEFWNPSLNNFYQPVDYLWQPTMFQPVGGMDMVWKAFEANLVNPPILNAPVTQINLIDNGVEVFYEEDGEGKTITADYCISNIPLPVLSDIPSNFTTDFQNAVDHVEFARTCKVGWQSNARFWETDEEIYGGISWINHNITQMWYPSYEYFTEKGTLTGAYNFSERAEELASLNLDDRLRVARSGAVRLHRQFGDESIVPTDKGLSIAWKQVPFMKGGWADWDHTKESDRLAYQRLLAPDGNFFIVGDQVSPLPGWQEGAMMSAQHVTEQISGFRTKKAKEVAAAPNSRGMTEGW